MNSISKLLVHWRQDKLHEPAIIDERLEVLVDLVELGQALLLSAREEQHVLVHVLAKEREVASGAVLLVGPKPADLRSGPLGFLLVGLAGLAFQSGEGALLPLDGLLLAVFTPLLLQVLVESVRVESGRYLVAPSCRMGPWSAQEQG